MLPHLAIVDLESEENAAHANRVNPEINRLASQLFKTGAQEITTRYFDIEYFSLSTNVFPTLHTKTKLKCNLSTH